MSEASRARLLRTLRRVRVRQAELDDHHRIEQDEARATAPRGRETDQGRPASADRAAPDLESFAARLRASEAQLEDLRAEQRVRRAERLARVRRDALRVAAPLIRRRAEADGPLGDGNTLPHELRTAVRHLELTRTEARAYQGAVELGALLGTLHALIDGGGRLGQQVVPGQDPRALSYGYQRPAMEPTPLQSALDRGFVRRAGDRLVVVNLADELSTDEPRYPGLQQIAESARRAAYSSVRRRLWIARALAWLEIAITVLLIVLPPAMALFGRLREMRQVWLGRRGVGTVVPASEAAHAIDATVARGRATAGATGGGEPGTALAHRPGTALATRGTDARLAAPRQPTAPAPEPPRALPPPAGPNAGHGHGLFGAGHGVYLVRLRTAVRTAMQRVAQRKVAEGRRWLTNQHYGDWLHEELEAVVEAGGLRLPGRARVFAETRFESLPGAGIPQSRLQQSVQRFIDTLTHVPRAVRQRMRGQYRGRRDTTIGRLQPDIVVDFDGSYAIIDLTSRTNLAHLAKSRLYQEILALSGRARSTVEIYWGALTTP